jgi:thiol:disulfide interchange protein
MRHVLIFRTVLVALTLIAIGACSDRNKAQATTRAPTADSERGTAVSAEPLPPERAFPLKVDSLDQKTLLAVFTPAPDHYMYRSKIGFALKDATGVQLEAVALPPGIPKRDPFLGEQEIYRQPVQISLPLARVAGVPAKFTLVATYQGCNEKIGLCYSPIETTFEFNLP